MNEFLPISKKDMDDRGWDACDFIMISGDAYVDHPSYGPAIITRVLESHGYRVGMIAQPDWKDENSVTVLGLPKYAFLVSGGNMDSMVNHYTAAKKHRGTDAYSPGGEMGKRPDRATIVYCNLLRKVYKQVPIIIGGIEASLRRFAHYDYWSDSLKHSILIDSQADLLIYGMGERAVVETADALASGIAVRDVTFIRGTSYVHRGPLADILEDLTRPVVLPSFDSMKADKKQYADSFYTQYLNTDPFSGRVLIEPYTETESVIQNTPALPLSIQEMDDIYDLPYMRTWHPIYREAGGIPGFGDLRFSLTSNRGCFGGCSFCALTFHQGRILQVRSHASLLKEAAWMTRQKDFKGYIFDVGGPTANLRHPACEKQLTKGACQNRQCLFPTPCPHLQIDHTDYASLLRELTELPGVKKVFIRSGLRFDYLIADPDRSFMRQLCREHVSGQLKVAPEHVCSNVLELMGKPGHEVYERFIHAYQKENNLLGKEQYVVPYLISSHPGSTLKEAVLLAEYVRDLGYMPEQVQDFYPTPSTLSTCMYYTGIDPRTKEAVYVPKSSHEKAMQRALIQYRNPKNYALVKEALYQAHREDLIGFDGKCLIRPYPPEEHTPERDSSTHGHGKNSPHDGHTHSSGGSDRRHNDRYTGNAHDNDHHAGSNHGSDRYAGSPHSSSRGSAPHAAPRTPRSPRNPSHARKGR